MKSVFVYLPKLMVEGRGNGNSISEYLHFKELGNALVRNGNTQQVEAQAQDQHVKNYPRQSINDFRFSDV